MTKVKRQTAEERVLSYLKKRKTPATAAQVANALKANTSTVRNAITYLVLVGRVWPVGKEKITQGRPGTLYTAS